MPKTYTPQFWLLCLSSFLFFASFNMIIPELPAYLKRMGGEEYIGLIIALFTLAAALSRPISGKLTDTIGRIPVMVIGALVCFFVGIAYPFVNSIIGFFVLRFLHGMSTGFKPTGTATYMADIVPVNKRGEAMGLLGVFLSLGMTAGLSVGSVIAQKFSYDIMFYTSGTFGILSVLILAGMKESLEKPQKFSFKLLKIKWVDVIEPRVLKPSLVMALTSFSFGIILTIIPDFSEHLGIKNKGLFFTSFTLASLAIRLIAGKVSDIKGRVFVLRLSTLMIGIAMILVAFSTTYAEFITASIVFGVAIGMNSPTLFAWAVDLSDEKYRGRAMSTIFISLEIGIGLGAVLSGWLYQNNPLNFKVTFLAGGVVALVSFIYTVATKNTIHESLVKT